jgi:hypothetical protein
VLAACWAVTGDAPIKVPARYPTEIVDKSLMVVSSLSVYLTPS